MSAAVAPQPATAPAPARREHVIAAYAAVYIIWGSTYLAIRYAVETLPPFLMAGARFILAGGALTLWARLRGAPAPTRVHWRSAAIVGGLMLVGGNGAVVWAETRVTSSLAALIVATTPLWMALMEGLRPGGTRPTARTGLGLLLGFAGVVILIGPANLTGGPGSDVSLAGALAVVGGSIAWAAGSLYSRHAPLPESPLLGTGMEMLAGGVLLVILGLARSEPSELTVAAFTPSAIVALIYLIIAGSLIGFTSYVWLLRVSSPARVATYAYVNPVVAVLLGYFIASEALSGRTIVAAAVIVSAVAVIVSAKKKA